MDRVEREFPQDFQAHAWPARERGRRGRAAAGAKPCLMLIRHAEKPGKRGVGLDAFGKPDPGGLSVRGWQRAGALVRFFASPGEEGEALGIRRPAAIFAAVDAHRSRRPALTVLPLARALDLPIVASHGSGSPPSGVIAAALSCGGPVLMCWRHRALPRLVAELLGEGRAPGAWNDERFDLVWLLDRGDADAAWRFRALPQRLLPGDGATA